MEVSVNLSRLKHVVKTTKNAKGDDIQVLILPIKENSLYMGEKGSISLNIKAYEMKEPRVDGRKVTTHILKQSLGKEVYSTLTEEEKKELPIIGNVYEWEGDYSVGNIQSKEIDDTVEIDDDMPLPF